MTMIEVLEGIRGLGERFNIQDKRLLALERETGMVDDEDEDDDEAKKKAEAAMADDDDPDKDRGRSTRAPRTMTRAEMHRAAKAKDKQARAVASTGTLGSIPTQGPAETRWAMPG